MSKPNRYSLMRIMLLAVILMSAVGVRVVASDSGMPQTPQVSAAPPDSIADASANRLTGKQRKRVRVGSQSADSLSGSGDSIAAPATHGIRIVRTQVDLNNAVEFASKDSLVLNGQNNAYLYGEGTVTYGTVKLDAAQIDMDMNTSVVYAVGMEDSTGVVNGTPVFDENGTTYESKTMRYNFETGRGYITDIITQQGEGYLTGGRTKKIDDDTFYIEDGTYSTCDNHEHPHFYMKLTKGKVRPGKDIVVGPAYMVLAGLPLPLAVPFGYFPFTESYSSGVIFPTFGDDYNRGFYLSNGGYYFAISDNVDLALTGEVYTKGSWGINAQSAYVRRYKYNGSFNMNYLKTVTGDKGSADRSTQTNMQIQWSHTQDSKANPNLSFSASVNFTTSGYSRSSVTNYYSPSFTENTKSSSVNLTYRPPGTKWSISATGNLSQRTQDSTLTVGLPSLTVNLSQVYPFKRKIRVGKERWYEKIRFTYSGQFNNSLTARQDVFFKKSLIKDWRNGMKHAIPLSATFNVFNYINITPSVNVNDRMYTSKVRRQWDPNASAEVMDTTYSLYNVWDFNASLSLDTKLYGFYQPLPFLGNKVKMIRHVLTPTVSFSGNPDFGSPFFGYYGSYDRPGRDGNPIRTEYSYFPNALFGVPGKGRSGTVSYSLNNNVEMKVRDDRDSTGMTDKKISLIESLNISQSYNFAADSLNWSNITTSLMLRLVRNFNLNLNATWDVYTYQLNASGQPVRVNIPRWKAGKGIGRLSSTGTSFSYTFNNGTFKNLFGRKKEGGGDSSDRGSSSSSSSSSSSHAKADPDGYLHWSCPWNLSVNYSVNYGYGAFDPEKLEYKGKITQNLSFSGNIKPTANWNLSFSSSYNFDTGKLAYMNCNISRNLHCFTMTASFVPVGPYKSYNFHIAVNSSLLSDLKYDRRSSISNGVQWY